MKYKHNCNCSVIYLISVNFGYYLYWSIFKISENIIKDAWRLGHSGLVQVIANIHKILVWRNYYLHSPWQIQSPQSKMVNTWLGFIHHKVWSFYFNIDHDANNILIRFHIWRPVTALFYYPLTPQTGFHFLINLYFLYNYR